MFGDLPATGLFARHLRNLEMHHVEIATATPDPRPAIWLEDVADADITNLRAPRGETFALTDVTGFHSTGARWLKDRQVDGRITDRF